MAFLGMRGNGDWVTDQQPENWREMMLYLYPNGGAPLTAIMSKLGSESVNDPTFHWWMKTLPTQHGAVTGTYDDALLAVAYTAAADTAGTIIYVKVAEAVASVFIPGKQIVLTKDGDYRYMTRAKCTAVTLNGANSSITVRLIETASATYGLDEADYIFIASNSNAEGAEMPTAVAYDPTEKNNYTQIFRNSLSITRTAKRTRLRTGDQYKEAKRECLELHALELEKGFLFGQKTSATGANGKPERTTKGLVTAVLEEAGAVSSYKFDTAYSGQSWLQGGEDWLDLKLEEIFRYGDQEKFCLCGNLAVHGINNLAKSGGQINLRPMSASYGLRVMEWVTPFGTLYLKTHPLFNEMVPFRRSMLIFEPRRLRFRYIDDTKFTSDPEDQRNRNNSKDSTEEEYLTEAGLEYHFVDKTAGWLDNVGQANAV